MQPQPTCFEIQNGNSNERDVLVSGMAQHMILKRTMEKHNRHSCIPNNHPLSRWFGLSSSSIPEIDSDEDEETCNDLFRKDFCVQERIRIQNSNCIPSGVIQDSLVRNTLNDNNAAINARSIDFSSRGIQTPWDDGETITEDDIDVVLDDTLKLDRKASMMQFTWDSVTSLLSTASER